MRFFRIFIFLGLFALVSVSGIFAQASQFPDGSTRGTTEMGQQITGVDFPAISFTATSPRTGREVAFSVQLLVLLTLLTLAPSIFILMTCFLRFSIVLDFIKRALSLQQVPPTAVLNGIALFMTIFCMWPTFSKIYENSFKPMSQNEITLEEAFHNAEMPLRLFMVSQMGAKQTEDGQWVMRGKSMSYIQTFITMAKIERPRTLDDLPTYILIPAYILHELTVAFRIGIVLYIPFIVIDMVVASILMSMGMMMLPPVQISMPFKLMLFVLVDGWGLLTQQLFISVIN